MTANQLEQGHFHSYQYLITSVTASKSLQYIQSYTLQLPYPAHAKYHNFWYLQNTTSKKIFSNFLFLYFWVALCNELDFQPSFHAFSISPPTRGVGGPNFFGIKSEFDQCTGDTHLLT